MEKFTEKEALDYHSQGKPGKIEIIASKPMSTQRDLALAYSPGVAVPVEAIAKDPSKAYDYTSKGNTVAVISNGSAILGLGNLGALASKPVMEGKAVLFKRFADIDSIDIEVDSQNADEIINCIAKIGNSFGGINLEDIASPDCFIIEQELKNKLKIPVFHDDQHGTAIITVAGILNALEIVKKSIKKVRIVANGAGAAGISCISLLKAMGLPDENVVMLDRDGVIYKGRPKVDQFKSTHAVDTKLRTLEEAMKGADIFLGLSAKNVVTPAMVKSMAKDPIIFACANPDPEILPELIEQTRSDAIIATGRSDYPNQVNNVLGFPYIFRGALDCRAKTINEEMKIAAAKAIADLAKEDVPDEVVAAYGGERPKFGKNYIIPSPFDPRLIRNVSAAVAEAAMKSGVAQKKIEDFSAYKDSLAARLDPSVGFLQNIYAQVRKKQKRVIFAEGEEESMLRAAIDFKNNGLGTPVLIGSSEKIAQQLKDLGLTLDKSIEIHNSKDEKQRERYTNHIYKRLQRKGFLKRDCDRLIRTNRIVFGSCMVDLGDADAMVTGVTRTFSDTLENIKYVVDERPGEIIFGLTIAVTKKGTVFIADTNVHEYPTAENLADIAISSARVAKILGFTPRVAFLAHSTFGKPMSERSIHLREARDILENRKVDFEFEGEMQPDVALNQKFKTIYPFSKLSAPANILIMPAIHSAAISTKLLKELGGCTLIGPLLIGLNKPIEIATLRSKVSDIFNMAAIAAFSSDVINYKKN
ncbi:MAG: NADP-dependent malic enzyme [Candidatus Fonsibacter ubiquis]|jgi:malate dehydrogenase (oxaloacetate-decarboxylating)(NADP+)|nr:NADP-dependent malic enzyme [Pelagibacterales bacterium]HRD24134.1 NADP-dependent malic enzyme [Candidatus Fonsibacter ubiquis]